jgi:tetratricopeptide (TPR) repeat protein
MASKKRVKKRRIKEDQLVTFTVKASQFIQQYFTHVVIGLAVLVVAVGAILVSGHLRRNAARESEREFALAMSQYNLRDLPTAETSFRQIADKYGSHANGELSRYFLGKTLLAEGKYDDALKAFDRYLSKSAKDAPFRAAASIGKASCMEELRNFAPAAEVLEQLSQTLDEKDPRFFDVLLQAGRDFERAGSRDKAAEFYRRVAEDARGTLKDRASVALSHVE